MGELPRWYPVAAVGFAATVGAAVGAGWSVVHPAGSPGAAGLGALCAAAGAAGTAAAARPRGALPRRRTRLVAWARAAARIAPEVVAGVLGAALLTGRWVPCLLVLALLRVVRGQAFRQARRVLAIRMAGNPATAVRARAALVRWIPAAMGVAALCVLGSGLDHTGGLGGWRSAPLVLAAGAAALVLLTGVEREALAARFRRARAAVDPDLGQGWWRAAGGWIVLILAAAALLPTPPGALAPGHVLQALVNWTGRLLLVGATPAPSAAAVQPPAPPLPTALAAGWRGRAALWATLGLMLGLGIWVAVDLWRSTSRLRVRFGGGLRELLSGLAAAMRDTLALARAFAAALGAEVRGGGWLGAWRVLWAALRDAGAGLLELALGWWSRRRRRGGGKPGGPARRAAPSPSVLSARWDWDLAAGDPRRLVREAYRAFIAATGRAGLGRGPAQTPSAHRRTLEQADPEVSDALEELTAVYEWARFSPHPVTRAQVQAAQHGWRRLALRLAARVRKGRGA